MSLHRFDSILLPHDGSAEACKALGCGAWLAERLDATLHVLTPVSVRVDPAYRARVVLHRTIEDPCAALCRATAALAVRLIVMTARGASASAGVDPDRRLGNVAQALMASSTVPVLLLPVHYREILPWRSMLVGASGEPASDQALQTALHLGAALRIELDVMFCEDPWARPPALGGYADAAHHEMPQRLRDVVCRTALRSPDDERCGIAQVVFSPGDAASGLLAEVQHRNASVLALGWHGTLAHGRARVLKQLLERAECPLLLVREPGRQAVTLKVADRFGESRRGVP